MELYLKNNLELSKRTTRSYSTSFSLGIRALKPEYQSGIYAIYGFVRFADEIVDTFFDQDQRQLLNDFKKDAYKAIEDGFSINPILHSFQWAVNEFSIDHHLIESFMKSMEMDLDHAEYDQNQLQSYIYGSAEVVGLMCLRVFYKNDSDEYERLIEPARKLGEAFQKVNFLRDAQDDFEGKGRVYFRDIDFARFDQASKFKIEQEIEEDFKQAYEGIKELKKEVRFGVYLAYRYYLKLLKKIQLAKPDEIMQERFRVSDSKKVYLLFNSLVRNTFNLF